MQSGHFAPATLKCLLSLDLNISSEDLIMKQAPQITILFPITFFSKDLRNKASFSIPVQMQVWEADSGIHTGFFSMVSTLHTWKNVLCGSKHFLACMLLLPPPVPLCSYSSKCWFQRRNCSKSNLPIFPQFQS